MPRPDWDDYFLNIAREVARRSNCRKRQIGSVITRDHRILTTGYNGTPLNVKTVLRVVVLVVPIPLLLQAQVWMFVGVTMLRRTQF